MREKLEQLKSDGEALRTKPDVLWHLLLQCASTMGNARGWFVLFGDQKLLATVSYRELAKLPPRQRKRQILRTLQKAKVRMSPIKSEWLAQNFNHILDLGGVEKASQFALGLSTQEEKLAFVRSFYGIGEKYGRNFWMDIYDPHFRNTMAVDQRIKNITTEIGCNFRNYSEYEEYYGAIAREANLELWELDRLLFWFNDHFMAEIRS